MDSTTDYKSILQSLKAASQQRQSLQSVASAPASQTPLATQNWLSKPFKQPPTSRRSIQQPPPSALRVPSSPRSRPHEDGEQQERELREVIALMANQLRDIHSHLSEHDARLDVVDTHHTELLGSTLATNNRQQQQRQPQPQQQSHLTEMMDPMDEPLWHLPDAEE